MKFGKELQIDSISISITLNIRDTDVMNMR